MSKRWLVLVVVLAFVLALGFSLTETRSYFSDSATVPLEISAKPMGQGGGQGSD